MKNNRSYILLILVAVIVLATAFKSNQHSSTSSEKWISLFNGKDLTGWTSRGVVNWKVVNGVITGSGGLGHLYADPVVTDFEAKGEFRITDLGNGANSGFYFRSNESKDNPNGFPRGYEAQICNSQDAFTGWLWKPGTPTGKASALLTKNGEWFTMRVKAVGSHIQIWVKDSLVTTHDDADYSQGHFALQCHNDKMLAEARNLYYRVIK
jgi:hypothetical protein